VHQLDIKKHLILLRQGVTMKINPVHIIQTYFLYNLWACNAHGKYETFIHNFGPYIWRKEPDEKSTRHHKV